MPRHITAGKHSYERLRPLHSFLKSHFITIYRTMRSSPSSVACQQYSVGIARNLGISFKGSLTLQSRGIALYTRKSANGSTKRISSFGPKITEVSKAVDRPSCRVRLDSICCTRRQSRETAQPLHRTRPRTPTRRSPTGNPYLRDM
jgi:hypothetical protein